MAPCKAMILVSAFLLVPTFQMRIKQVKEVTPPQPAAASGEADEQAATSHEDMEQTLERLRQRYMQPEVTLNERKDHPTRAKEAAKKSAAKADGDVRRTEDKARAKAKKEKANGRAKKAAHSEEVDLAVQNIEQMVAPDQEELAEAAQPEADKQDMQLTLQRLRQRYMQPELTMTPRQRVPAVAEKDGPTRTKQAVKKKRAKHARHSEDKARAKAEEEKARGRAKKGAHPEEMVADLVVENTVEKIFEKEELAEAKGPEADKQGIELTLELIQQRYMQPELIRTPRQRAPVVAERDRLTSAKQAVKKRAAKVDGAAGHAEDEARAKAKKNRPGRKTRAQHAEKIAAKEQEALAEAARPEADKQDMELTLDRLRQRYMQPELTMTPRQRAPVVAEKDRPTRAKQALNKRAPKVAGGAGHAEDEARAKAKKETAKERATKAEYFEQMMKIFEKMVAKDQVEVAEAAWPEADEQERAPAVAEADGPETLEEQKDGPTRTKQTAKQWVAKADGDARHAEGKTREKTKKGTYSKETVGDLVVAQTVDKMLGQEELAEATAPEVDKQDIELTLERLRQRYAKPEVILTESPEAQKDQPTGAKQAAKKWAAKADGDAGHAEDKAREKVNREVKAKEHAKKAAANKATAEKVAAEKPTAKKILVEAWRVAPKVAAFSKRRPRRKAEAQTTPAEQGTAENEAEEAAAATAAETANAVM